MMLMKIRHAIDLRPGMPETEFAIHCYAMDLFTDLMDQRRLTVFDDVNMLETVTESDLLNGSRDWINYSLDGNSLIWTDDITMRLWGKRRLTPEEIIVLTEGKGLLLYQADVLKQAAVLLLNTLGTASQNG